MADEALAENGEPERASPGKIMDEVLSARGDAVARSYLVALSLLGDDPYRRNDVDVEAIASRPGFRLRVGRYRLVYQVDGGHVITLVITAGRRRDIYER